MNYPWPHRFELVSGGPEDYDDEDDEYSRTAVEESIAMLDDDPRRGRLNGAR